MSEELAGPEEAEADNDGGKGLTPEQWAEIRNKYELGIARGGALSREYGVSATAISKHFSRHKVGKFGCRRHELEKEIKEQTTKGAAAQIATTTAGAVATSFAAKRKARIEETKEHVYQSASVLHALAMKIAKDHANAGASGTPTAGSRAADIKGLRGLTAILKETMEMRYRVLDADSDVDEAELPTLPILVLTDEDIAAEQQRHEEDDDDFAMPDLSDVVSDNDAADADDDEIVVEE